MYITFKVLAILKSGRIIVTQYGCGSQDTHEMMELHGHLSGLAKKGGIELDEFYEAVEAKYAELDIDLQEIHGEVTGDYNTGMIELNSITFNC